MSRGREPFQNRPHAGIHYDHLTGMRAIAALMVLLLHAWTTTYQGPTGATNAHAWILSWAQYGGYGVTIFIVLSGYSLMLGPTKNAGILPGGARTFFIRRARRVLPAYWAVLTLSAALGLTLLRHPKEYLFSLSVPVGSWDFVGHVFLLHDLIGNSSGINYVLWSMAVEWHIYLLVPLFLVAIRRIGAWPLAIGVTTLTSLVVRALAHHTDIRLIDEFQLVGCFAIGMASCWLARNRPDPRPLLAGASAVGLLWVALLVASSEQIAPNFLYRQSLGVVLAVSVALFLAGAPQMVTAMPVRALGARSLCAIGDWSFSVYLLHPLVLSLLWNYWIHGTVWSSTVRFVVLASAATCITVAASAVSFRFIEEPWLSPRQSVAA